MKYFPLLIAIMVGCLFFGSCTQTTEVPFSKELTETVQPETVPLELTDSQPLHWDTVKKGTLTPTVFPLDFSKMKGRPYDSRGFKPLPLAPTEATFDFGSLPSKTFDPTKAPVQKMKMTMKPLPETFASLRAPVPKRVTASSLDLQKWKASLTTASPVSFIKDSKGFLWIGTTYGLFRFDGTHLENILPKARVAGMNIDNAGRIWFTSQISETSSSINVVDLEKGLTGTFELPYRFFLGTPLNRDSDGALWVISFQKPKSAVIRISPEKLTYQALDNKTHLKNERYFEVVEDGAKNKWLSSSRGIDIILKGTDKVINLSKVNGLSSDTIRAMTLGPDGRMWVAWPNGVDAIDVKQGKITRYQTNFSTSNRILKLKFDKEGQLWQGGIDNGITLLNLMNNTFRNINERDGMEGASVTDIFDDGKGRMFFSNLNSNLAGAIYVVGQYGKTVYPFGNEVVYSAVEDSKGHLWIGTGERLYAVDSVRKTYWHIDSSKGLANNFIQSVTTQNGNVVITTINGYNVFNAEKNELLRYSKPEGLLAGNIYSVMPDAAGNQWISADTNGIYKYDPTKKLTLQLTQAGGLNGSVVLQTLKTKEGNVWVMTSDGSAGFINPSTHFIQTIKNYPALSDPGEKIIFVDSHDRIWFALSAQYGVGGLYMVDSKNKTISKFLTQNGLSNNYVLSILEHEGKIVIGTRKKINIITPPELTASKKWKVDILKGSESLAKIENSYASDAITKRGNYIWGDDGIRIIYGLDSDTSAAQCYVTGVDIMAQPINFLERSDTGSQKTEMKRFRWDSLAGPYFMPQNLRLPYNKNVLQFQFTEMSTGRVDSTTYAYILEGLDEKWITTTDDHTQTYLNLAPGKYIFKVRSKWSGGKWSEPSLMPFTISPPWYNTWWAYLIYIVGGLILLRLYLNFRSRKLKRENKILEEKVTQRTEELQQSYNNVEQLGQIGRKITSSLSVEKIIGTAYKNVNALMDAAVFGIGIYHAETGSLDFPATHENGQQLVPYSNSVHDENRFGSICYNSGKEIVMSDLGEQYKDFFQQLPNPNAGQQAVSLIYLPLAISDNKLGVITVQSFKKNAYSENHLNMLRNIANYTAIALENAGSYSKLNQSLEDLKETQKQLIQSEKMASLGELTAGIAHEIQNPLNFVNNFSDVNKELLAEMKEEMEKGNTDDAKAIANDVMVNEEKINHHGKRADAIVKGMLQHSRKNSGQKEPTDINALADEYLRLSYHGLRAKDKTFNATMKTDFDESIGKINIIPQDMGRVLLNLFNNAFYAVSAKKKLNISGFDPTVFVNTKKTDDKVFISVKDNGNGIPKEIVDKIYQPFFTTKPTGEGTGLGLSMSYDIVKAHEGTLEVETKEGGFTEFRITLPVLR